MRAAERGSLINGMTLEELQDSYYGILDDDLSVDIGNLI